MPTIPNVTPYKIDIQQGNYVTQEMVAKLKPGMTRAQVRFVLGTPLVADMFHRDRWDYVYIYRKGGEVTEHRSMTVIFKDDKLARLEGDVVPAKPTGPGPGAKPKPSPNATTSGPAGSAPERKPSPTAAPSQPDGANLSTSAGDPLTAGPAQSGSGDSKTRADNPKTNDRNDGTAGEKSFFGRMFEKLGF